MDRLRNLPLPLDAIKCDVLPYSNRREEIVRGFIDALHPLSRFHAVKTQANSYFIYYGSIARPLAGISFAKYYVELSFYPLLISFPGKRIPERLKAIGNYVSFRFIEMSSGLTNDIRELIDDGIKYWEWLDDLDKNSSRKQD